jgi:cytochrome c biogenesis protein CcdA
VGTSDKVAVRGAGASRRTLFSLAAVSLLALAGYFGFRLAVSLDLASETGTGVIVLATITGFFVFFSPCSFPLLIAMLAGSDRAASAGHRRREGFTTALAIGLGASVFLLTVGLVVGLVGEGLVQSIGFSTTPGRLLRGGVAAVILVAGLTQLGVVQLPLWRLTRFAQPLERRRADLAGHNRRAAQTLYGFGFVIAGFG